MVHGNAANPEGPGQVALVNEWMKLKPVWNPLRLSDWGGDDLTPELCRELSVGTWEDLGLEVRKIKERKPDTMGFLDEDHAPLPVGMLQATLQGREAVGYKNEPIRQAQENMIPTKQ